MLGLKYWAAPLLWRSAIRNTLAGYLRRRALSFDQARAVQADAEGLLAGAEHEVESLHLLEPVRDSDCSAYDCEFVALATRLGVQLVTMDTKLLRAFPKHPVALALSCCKEATGLPGDVLSGAAGRPE